MYSKYLRASQSMLKSTQNFEATNLSKMIDPSISQSINQSINQSIKTHLYSSFCHDQIRLSGLPHANLSNANLNL